MPPLDPEFLETDIDAVADAAPNEVPPAPSRAPRPGHLLPGERPTRRRLSPLNPDDAGIVTPPTAMTPPASMPAPAPAHAPAPRPTPPPEDAWDAFLQPAPPAPQMPAPPAPQTPAPTPPPVPPVSPVPLTPPATSFTFSSAPPAPPAPQTPASPAPPAPPATQTPASPAPQMPSPPASPFPGAVPRQGAPSAPLPGAVPRHAAVDPSVAPPLPGARGPATSSTTIDTPFGAVAAVGVADDLRNAIPEAPLRPRAARSEKSRRGRAWLAVALLGVITVGAVLWITSRGSSRNETPEPVVVTTTTAGPVTSKSPVRKGQAQVTSGATTGWTVTIAGTTGQGSVDLTSGAYTLKVPANAYYGDGTSDPVEVRSIGGQVVAEVPAALRARTGGASYVDAAALAAAPKATQLQRMLGEDFGVRLRVLILGLGDPAGDGESETIRGVPGIRRREPVNLGAVEAGVLNNDARVRSIIAEYRALGSALTIDVWRSDTNAPLQMAFPVPLPDGSSPIVYVQLFDPGVGPTITSIDNEKIAQSFSK